MRLVIVRHAIAEDREIFNKKNKDDNKRPLTKEGARVFKKNSKALKILFPNIKKIISSPLVRAVETAKILNEKYKLKIDISNALKPEMEFTDLILLLSNLKQKDVIIVGHESFLSEFVGFLTTGHKKSTIKMKKGGVCVLDIESFNPPYARIRTLLTPKELEKIV